MPPAMFCARVVDVADAVLRGGRGHQLHEAPRALARRSPPGLKPGLDEHDRLDELGIDVVLARRGVDELVVRRGAHASRAASQSSLARELGRAVVVDQAAAVLDDEAHLAAAAAEQRMAASNPQQRGAPESSWM